MYKEGKISYDEDWPIFDCRCFSLPSFEIVNYFWWRLLDAKRNSIQSVAQSKFSHKQLLGKKTDQMQEMLFQEYSINWAKLPQEQKAGMFCIKKEKPKQIEEGPKAGEIVIRKEWCAFPSPSSIGELIDIMEPIGF